jgi:hypothetical protein
VTVEVPAQARVARTCMQQASMTAVPSLARL